MGSGSVNAQDFSSNPSKDDSFDISANTTYTVVEEGMTRVSQKIQILNKKDYIYTPTYTVTSGIPDITNVRAYSKDGELTVVLKKSSSDQTSIEVQFSKRTVGSGKVNEFVIEFTTYKIAKKRGSVWEIDIPGIADMRDFKDYTAQLKVPSSFGGITIIKPQKNFKSSNEFIFTKDELGKSGIFIVFGKRQYYNYSLSYHIMNKNLFPVSTEIALPPTNNYQNVLLNSLIPPAQNVYLDRDNNWMAVYFLKPGQKLTIQALGKIELFSAPKEESISQEDKVLYTQGRSFWESQDNEIKKKAGELKTPFNIYSYVVKTLSYDYSKVTGKNERLGAKNVLNKTSNAVCLEFTDLFIALTRAAGIPARSVEGYAFTDNSKLRPLSLLKDVLHAWPEYYDFSKKTWVMVDPTWGNTTFGMDYFTSLDFEHITFIQKGVSSTYPVPAGGYKFTPLTKDVNISFSSQRDFVMRSGSIISTKLQDSFLSGLPISGSVIIRNNGNSLLKKQSLVVSSALHPNITQIEVADIPPYGYKEYALSFKKTPFLTNRAYDIVISFNGETMVKRIQVGVIPNSIIFLIGGVFSVAAIIALTVAIKTRRLSF